MKEKIKPAEILLLTGTFLLSIFFLEVGCFHLIQWKGWEPDGSYSAEYNRAASALHSWEEKKEWDAFQAVRQAHPYFGHVFRAGNNYGFIDPRDFPYRRANDEFVIGIFGGSTAMHWAEFLQNKERWPNKKGKGKKVVVLNLALSGMRQPQSMIVASRFLDNLDVALTLDGWNDTIVDGCPNLPTDYPQGYGLLFSPEATLNGDQGAYFLPKLHRLLSHWAELPVLRNSHTIFVAWKILGAISNQQQWRANEEINEKNAILHPYQECYAEKSSRLYGIWEKYTRQQKALADLAGVPSFHFVQPNPYIAEAKPMGETEARIVGLAPNREGASPIAAGNLMRNFLIQYEKKKPKNSTNLMYLFRRESRVVYIDAYTHLNELGYSLLSEEVERRLEQAGIFPRSPK